MQETLCAILEQKKKVIIWFLFVLFSLNLSKSEIQQNLGSIPFRFYVFNDFFLKSLFLGKVWEKPCRRDEFLKLIPKLRENVGRLGCQFFVLFPISEL